MGPRTRNAVAQLSPVNETVQDLPRGMKRARDTAAVETQAIKNAKTSENAAATAASNAKVAAQASPLLDDKLPLDPRRRRRGRVVQPADRPLNDDQQSSEAAQESPSPQQFRPSHNLTSPVSSPPGPIEKPRGSKLGRPNGLRRDIRKAPSKRGERVFDLEIGSSPEQRRTLPAVGAKAPKKQMTNTKTTRATSAATQENDVEDGISQKPTPRKRGRPRKKTEERNTPKESTGPSTGAGISGLQPLNEPLKAGSRKSRKPKVSRKSAPGRIEAAEEVSQDEENVSDEQDATGDDRDVSIEVQNGTVNENTHSREDMDTPALALLGQEQSWKKILDEVRKNCPDPKQNAIGKKKAVHKTKTIQNLSKDIKRARVQHKALGKGKINEDAQNEAVKHLDQVLGEIERQINDIKESDISENGNSKAQGKGPETIRDIYLRGVPDMIYLLRAAIDYHFIEDHNGYKYKSIQQVIRIQDMTIRLCNTAALWKAKPAIPEGMHIVKPIKSVVFPRLRDDVRKAFANEMQRLFVMERKKQNLEKRRTQPTQSSPSAQEEAELEAEQRAEVLHRMAEDIKQTQEEHRAKILAQTPQTHEPRSVSLQPRYSSHQPEQYDVLWTRDEEFELIIQLQQGTHAIFLVC